jgi:hypothetical protein
MPVTYYVWNQTALRTANTDPVFAGQNKGIYASNYVQVSSTSLPYSNVVLFQTDKGQVDENGNRVPDIGSGIVMGRTPLARFKPACAPRNRICGRGS